MEGSTLIGGLFTTNRVWATTHVPLKVSDPHGGIPRCMYAPSSCSIIEQQIGGICRFPLWECEFQMMKMRRHELRDSLNRGKQLLPEMHAVLGNPTSHPSGLKQLLALVMKWSASMGESCGKFCSTASWEGGEREGGRRGGGVGLRPDCRHTGHPMIKYHGRF